MSDILEKILLHKREEIATLRKRFSPQALADLGAAQPPPRGFAGALRARAAAGPEIGRASCRERVYVLV